MIIVANTHMLRFFKRISIFKLNLGNSMIDPKQEKIVYTDSFILKYLNMTSKQIVSFGSIGKLKFYQDFSLPENEFYIFNDESIYGLVYTEEDSKVTPEKYLASIVQEINEKEGIKDNDQELIQTRRDPDMRLPLDQYVEELLKKRNST